MVEVLLDVGPGEELPEPQPPAELLRDPPAGLRVVHRLDRRQSIPFEKAGEKDHAGSAIRFAHRDLGAKSLPPSQLPVSLPSASKSNGLLQVAERLPRSNEQFESIVENIKKENKLEDDAAFQALAVDATEFRARGARLISAR